MITDFLIYLFTGWRSVNMFGYPDPYQSVLGMYRDEVKKEWVVLNCYTTNKTGFRSKNSPAFHWEMEAFTNHLTPKYWKEKNPGYVFKLMMCKLF